MARIFHKPRVSTLIFYPVLLILIGVFFYMMSGLMDKLNNYLETYQAAHINTQYRQVFQELFDDPDWGALYDQAGIPDTIYEGRNAFVDYMEAKVGDAKLNCFIESNGTAGKKCLVYLEEEEIAVFYMESEEEAVTQRPWYFDIPFVETVIGALKLQAWHPTGDLLLHYSRQKDVSITTEADRIVSVNGVALTDAHRTSYTECVVESYLPEGLHGSRRQSFYLDGLLVEPEVTVTDLSGNVMEVIQVAPGQYMEIFEQPQISQELSTFIVDAGKVYSRFMINKAYEWDLKKYFDPSGSAYKSIISNELWMQSYGDYRFGDPVISEYRSYGKNLFSARLTMSLFCSRRGVEREYPVDITFFIQENSGAYKVTSMTNVAVQATATTVRLQFVQDDTLVATQMVGAAAKQLTLPAVEAPEGKVFSGWFRKTTAKDGSQTYSLVFQPQEGSTTVYLSGDPLLEPMTLYALFENKGEN